VVVATALTVRLLKEQVSTGRHGSLDDVCVLHHRTLWPIICVLEEGRRRGGSKGGQRIAANLSFSPRETSHRKIQVLYCYVLREKLVKDSEFWSEANWGKTEGWRVAKQKLSAPPPFS